MLWETADPRLNSKLNISWFHHHSLTHMFALPRSLHSAERWACVSDSLSHEIKCLKISLVALESPWKVLEFWLAFSVRTMSLTGSKTKVKVGCWMWEQWYEEIRRGAQNRTTIRDQMARRWTWLGHVLRWIALTLTLPSPGSQKGRGNGSTARDTEKDSGKSLWPVD